MRLGMMNIKTRTTKIAGFVFLMLALFAYGSSYNDKFKEAMNAGNLSEAQECLAKIDGRNKCQKCALQLIRAYMEVDAVDKAIHVYENITSWHYNRYDMQRYGENYEQKVCKLLRDYLVKNGEYEKALNYYPLEYDNENYIGNASSRYIYVSDVVADLCHKGKQEEARRFVEQQLRWFVAFVDMESHGSQAEVKESFNSTLVREELLQQIDNSY